MKVLRQITSAGLKKLFEQLSGDGGGSFAVTDKHEVTVRYGNGEPQFSVRFNDDEAFGLSGGDLLTSFGEAYMDGRIDIEGDLADFIALALRCGLVTVTQQPRPGLAGVARAAVADQLRAFSRNKENIARHYDLGNDFFRLWLDESMTYSCAYFRHAADSLALAQHQKIDHTLKKLRLQPDEKLLDIGCGWGALVRRAAEHYRVTATGLTLSEEQHRGANAVLEKCGLRDRVEVRLMDYGALPAEGKQFDKIVSVGMIEHVGKENLAGFVQTVEQLLKPGGAALLHLITVVNEGPITPWLEKNIFPGGYIPTLPEIITHLGKRDFRVWEVENLAPHYRLTLDHWSERFERVVPPVREKFDERFVRMWRLYLRMAAAAFQEGAVEVHQILVSRGQPCGLPLTRADIYRE